MGFIADPNTELTAVALVPAINAVANINATNGVDVVDFKGGLKVIRSAGVGLGTNPTADVFLQHSNEINANFTNLNISFSQTANANITNSVLVDTRSTKRYVKAQVILGGTNPNVPVSVVAVGLKQVDG